ncbi:hypothetical protein P5673_023215 [Acropora cervicornis]|uniref:Uncharacterized protein n=1 Tax=Acropora cervicornis TaxID=6130 RepID=A0AAD9Q6I8_ACRCE|nr:hypothetical protein P5673_023215 [Acropora cervicornis]
MFYLCRGCMYLTTVARNTGIYTSVKPFSKSACTKEPLDLLETQLLQGLSFLKRADTDLYDRSYSNILYSLPCNYCLIRIFLANFQTKQMYYEADMKKCAKHSKIITCDHTFKVSKSIGARRGGDNKFVQQFHNLFISECNASLFPGLQVKLDLFHVVQRVTKCILKGKEFLSRSRRNSEQYYKKMREILRPISIIF